MFPEKILTIGVILPHTKVFGGVKRFFEIGNILIGRGHKFMVFTPDGQPPDWFPFQGPTIKLSVISGYSFDALFTTEPDYLGELEKATTSLRIFYAVLQRRYIKRVAARKDLLVFANSERLYQYLGGEKKDNLVRCIGGIDGQKFQFHPKTLKKPDEPFNILVYGRFYRKKKGTALVVKACEALYRKGYHLKLLLFDAPVDVAAREKVSAFNCKLPHKFYVDYPVGKIAELYYLADIFVSAERNAGWSNTAAEAMACGVPVIATKSGTEDFLFHEQTGLVVWRHPWFIQRAIKRLYHDETLRAALAARARKKIEEFSWQHLAVTIETLIFTKLK
ncbi:MAG TPA: glycosyltransferase [Chryseosolibacter sp.]|nr:glycosyltransferase [Chryseosolibacter sp.]